MVSEKPTPVEAEFNRWFAQLLKDVLPERAKLLREVRGNMRDAFIAGTTAQKFYL